MLKNLLANVSDVGLIPGLGRSPIAGNGNPLQYCCLGNLIDRGAWWATVHGVTKSWTRLDAHRWSCRCQDAGSRRKWPSFPWTSSPGGGASTVSVWLTSFLWSQECKYSAISRPYFVQFSVKWWWTAHIPWIHCLYSIFLLTIPEDFIGVGNGNPLQDSCLENSMDAFIFSNK